MFSLSIPDPWFILSHGHAKVETRVSPKNANLYNITSVVIQLFTAKMPFVIDDCTTIVPPRFKIVIKIDYFCFTAQAFGPTGRPFWGRSSVSFLRRQGESYEPLVSFSENESITYRPGIVDINDCSTWFPCYVTKPQVNSPFILPFYTDTVRCKTFFYANTQAGFVDTESTETIRYLIKEFLPDIDYSHPCGGDVAVTNEVVTTYLLDLIKDVLPGPDDPLTCPANRDEEFGDPNYDPFPTPDFSTIEKVYVCFWDVQEQAATPGGPYWPSAYLVPPQPPNTYPDGWTYFSSGISISPNDGTYNVPGVPFSFALEEGMKVYVRDASSGDLLYPI
jgi:hypothetical protein